jgi:hypothetical protein
MKDLKDKIEVIGMVAIYGSFSIFLLVCSYVFFKKFGG